jgi:acetate kinase
MVFEVQRDGSQVNVLVIHTDGELEIARRTLECVRAVKS